MKKNINETKTMLKSKIKDVPWEIDKHDVEHFSKFVNLGE